MGSVVSSQSIKGRNSQVTGLSLSGLGMLTTILQGFFVLLSATSIAFPSQGLYGCQLYLLWRANRERFDYRFPVSLMSNACQGLVRVSWCVGCNGYRVNYSLRATTVFTNRAIRPSRSSQASNNYARLSSVSAATTRFVYLVSRGLACGYANACDEEVYLACNGSLFSLV